MIYIILVVQNDISQKKGCIHKEIFPLLVQIDIYQNSVHFLAKITMLQIPLCHPITLISCPSVDGMQKKVVGWDGRMDGSRRNDICSHFLFYSLGIRLRRDYRD